MLGRNRVWAKSTTQNAPYTCYVNKFMTLKLKCQKFRLNLPMMNFPLSNPKRTQLMLTLPNLRTTP